MNISADIFGEVKDYYKKFWEGVDKPLSLLFAEPQLGKNSWVDLALWKVRTKYGIQGISRQDASHAAECIARMEMKLIPTDLSIISRLIHKIASTFEKRYELSLASKFLHFCYPNTVPPFDQNAYAALCILQRAQGYKFKLKRSRPPKRKDDIEEWLKAFWDFHDQHHQKLGRLRATIINITIPKQDKKIAERAITTCKVCDMLLWKLGQ